MEEPFMIPVNYKGADREFEATLQVTGYTHRFQVLVDGIVVYYERDEEGHYRALIPPEEHGKDYPGPISAGSSVSRSSASGKLPDVHLLQQIAEAIETILAS